MRPTSLYRHYNKGGDLLYVGISLSVLARLRDHKDKSSWYYEISRVEIEHYATKADARHAECEAILSENPRHNVLVPSFGGGLGDLPPVQIIAPRDAPQKDPKVHWRPSDVVKERCLVLWYSALPTKQVLARVADPDNAGRPVSRDQMYRLGGPRDGSKKPKD